MGKSHASQYANFGSLRAYGKSVFSHIITISLKMNSIIREFKQISKQEGAFL